MHHLELHILQSVPVSCLNRDDQGSPKSAIFGGVKRARVSSQSWKRAIRDCAKDIAPDLFSGFRTRLIIQPLVEALQAENVENPEKAAADIADVIAKLDGTKADAVKTLFFTSPSEIRDIARNYAAAKSDESATKEGKKKNGKDAEQKLIKSILEKSKVSWVDAADIALFGRMCANNQSLTVEGAAMFSHALSTHRIATELDYFSAVDDKKPKDDDAGAGMIGLLQYNSATFYRFVAVNLDLLADDNHLGALSVTDRQAIVAAFIEAVLKAVPSARRNSMNANTLPFCVIGIVRDKGHPVQLINAFETPVKSKDGYAQVSYEKLLEEEARLRNRWGLESVERVELSDKSDLDIKAFVERMTKHVR